MCMYNMCRAFVDKRLFVAVRMQQSNAINFWSYLIALTLYRVLLFALVREMRSRWSAVCYVCMSIY